MFTYMFNFSVILGTLRDFEETSCLRQIDFSESAQAILQRAKSITSCTSQRRMTLNVRTDSLTVDENHFTVSSGDSILTGGGISPVVPELDSFERHTMRRKSMALAHAVSLDLFNRNTGNMMFFNNYKYFS
ncbi:unnamed protein product [Schistosoma curassoni]|uniref:Uncharacterized protein n=1 Tax=Schistosoma curassoni TaxID=6186 RepID=A0A183K1C8_9TREM|nr:unnamed protein product [Schistosoma curassoni]